MSEKIFNNILQTYVTRNPFGKMKQFLRWNKDEYSISTQQSAVEQDDGNETPSHPSRRKRPLKRNSVAPSENSEIKVINSPMRLNDIETYETLEKDKDESLHI